MNFNHKFKELVSSLQRLYQLMSIVLRQDAYSHKNQVQYVLATSLLVQIISLFQSNPTQSLFVS